MGWSVKLFYVNNFVYAFSWAAGDLQMHISLVSNICTAVCSSLSLEQDGCRSIV